MLSQLFLSADFKDCMRPCTESMKLHADDGRAIYTYIPFAGKSLQIYNEFVLTISRLNRDTNNSLAAVRLPIRKPGPHNSCGPVATLK